MANLHANVLQVGQPERMAELFAMISERSARLMNLGDYGLKVGNPAESDHRCANAGDGGRHDRAGARRLQTRPPDGRSAARSAPAPTWAAGPAPILPAGFPNDGNVGYASAEPKKTCEEAAP